MKDAQIEYYVVEYVPDITKADALPFAVVLFTRDECTAHFRSDWTPIKAAIPHADTEYMDALGRQIATSLASEEPEVAIVGWQNALGNNVQMRGPIAHDGDNTPDDVHDLIRRILQE
jgi:hypothetical protein